VNKLSWNSTHTALCVLGGIVISSFHYGIDATLILPLIAPIGAYIALRETNRIKKGG